MSLWKSLLFSVGVLLAAPSHAGQEIGNGGDVIICENGAIQVLDYWEGIHKWSLTPFADGQSQVDFRVQIHFILSRLSKVDPDRARLYRKWYDAFFDEMHFVNESLHDVQDSFNDPMPEGCWLEQVAVQNLPEVMVPGKYYYVNRRIWDLLDHRNKAGLILHEIIYREAIHYGHTDSRKVRYFNNIISSKEFSLLGELEYRRLLHENVGFPTIRFRP